MNRSQNPYYFADASLERTTSKGLLAEAGFAALRRLTSAWQGDALELRTPDGARNLLGDTTANRQHILNVQDWAFFRRILLGSDLGFAESWIQGEWTTPDLTGLLGAFARQGTTEDDGIWNLPQRALLRMQHLLHSNTRVGSRRNIAAHYDLGNSFYRQWLDASMQYSSAIYPHVDSTLEEAQDVKLRTLLRKLDLKPGMKVLEIGSGWGELGVRIVRDHGCSLVTVTLSQEQHALVQSRIAAEGLAGKMEVRLQDYRDLQGSFDRIVSIEMIEAVGHRNLPTYFGAVDRLLAKGGKAVLQAITMPEHRYERYLRTPDFIQQYIFPGACCPSIGAMVGAMGKATRLQVVALSEHGLDYARTLADWRTRFHAAWPSIAPLGFDDRFRRMWDYYLAYCEAGYRESILGLVQIELRRAGEAL